MTEVPNMFLLAMMLILKATNYTIQGKSWCWIYEEATWSWDAQEQNIYDFLSTLEEEGADQEIAIQSVTPPHSPPPLATSHAKKESTSERPRKTRDICDIYERSDEIAHNLKELQCLQINYEQLHFKEVVKNKRWRLVTEEEIHLI